MDQLHGATVEAVADELALSLTQPVDEVPLGIDEDLAPWRGLLPDDAHEVLVRQLDAIALAVESIGLETTR